MTRYTHILIFALVVVSIVSGCGRRVAEPDSRLAAADALMKERPDSALVILKGIDSLGGIKVFADDEANTAYFALLRVQADYRNYIVATQKSDSLIDIALGYYNREHNAHPDDKTIHEHYTRSLIYKGAVNEELGKPTEAIRWYKKAECAADPEDLFNLGFAKLRMAATYRNHYMFGEDYGKKYQESLDCFKQLGDKHYQIVCLVGLSTSYTLINIDSTIYYSRLASQLVDETGDKDYYKASCLLNIASVYFVKNNYGMAATLLDSLRRVYLHILPKFDDIDEKSVAFYSASGQLTKADSIARNIVPKHKTSYYWMKEYLAKAHGDSLAYYQYNEKATNMADSIIRDVYRSTLVSAEKEIEFDEKEKEVITAERDKKLWQNYTLIAILAGAILLAVLVILVLLYLNSRKNKALKITQLQHNLTMVQSKLSENERLLNEKAASIDEEIAKNKEMKALYEKELEATSKKQKESEQALQEKIESLEREKAELMLTHDKYHTHIKSIGNLNNYMARFQSLLLKILDKYYVFGNRPDLFNRKLQEIIGQEETTEVLWESVRSYADYLSNGALQKVQQSRNDLKDSELNLIAADLCEMPDNCIKVLLGFKNIKSISNKRRDIKNKLNVDSFNEI